MCNTSLLMQKIKDSGLKMNFIAEKVGLSYQGFLNKVQNKHDFRATEMMILKNLLNLTDEEFNQIFFADEVE